MKSSASDRGDRVCPGQNVDPLAARECAVWPDTFDDHHTALRGFNDFCRDGDFPANNAPPAVREEVSRAFDDALGVAFRLVREPKILPGGGGTQTHLARHLRSFATTQKGREQLAIEGFADALEVIPRVLAENAGLDPIDEILSLSAAQAEHGSWFGLDAMSGEKADMNLRGINDPLFVAPVNA